MGLHYSKDPEKLKIAVLKSKDSIKEKFGENGLREKISREQKEWYRKNKDYIESLSILPKEQISNYLQDRRDVYSGKSGNRKLIRDNPSVYNSLNFYCREYVRYNYSRDLPFVAKIDIANNNFELTPEMLCHCGSIISFDRQTQNWTKFYCKKCRKSPTSIDHFKIKYGDDWEIKWKQLRENLPVPKGKNETWILDEIEKIYGDKIKRDFTVLNFFPDGYSENLNIIFEVNESHHRIPSHRKKDTIRRKMIQKILKCDFVVIWDDTLDIDIHEYV